MMEVNKSGRSRDRFKKRICEANHKQKFVGTAEDPYREKKQLELLPPFKTLTDD